MEATTQTIKSRHGRLKSLLSHIKWFFIGLALIPSKLVYGNFAGFINNFISLVKLRRAQKKFCFGESIFSTTSTYLAETLHKEGICKLDSPFDPGTIKSIKEKYLNMIISPKYRNVSKNGCQHQLKDAIINIPELSNLITDEVDQILRSYYKCNYRVLDVSAWRNYNVRNLDQIEASTYDVFSNTFHHDATPRTSLRLFILLSDGVTRNTGSFRYHNKSISRSITKSFGFFSRPYMSKKTRERLLNINTLNFFEGNTGDAAICNTQECLHASSVPGPGSYRDMIQLYIEPIT